MDFAGVVREALAGSIRSVFEIARIVIPIMVFMEVLRDARLLDRFAARLAPGMRLFRLPPEAGLPLLAGIVFGISYGAGIILKVAEEGRLSKRDLFLLSLFLVICHSIIEDTLLFIAIGADGRVLLGRFLVAFFSTLLVARFWRVEDTVSPSAGVLRLRYNKIGRKRGRARHSAGTNGIFLSGEGKNGHR